MKCDQKGFKINVMAVIREIAVGRIKLKEFKLMLLSIKFSNETEKPKM